MTDLKARHGHGVEGVATTRRKREPAEKQQQQQHHRVENPSMEEERMKKKAATPSLTICRFREVDAQALARWAGDGRIFRHFHAFEELPGADLHAARRYTAQELVPQHCFLAVRLEGGGAPVGAVSVTRYPCAGGLQRGELGFFVEPESWGRGIATTAVGAVVGYAFGRWPSLGRLDAVVEAENGAAQRVLEKNGFVKEGALREHVDARGHARELFVYGLHRDHLGSHDEHPDIL